jgi:hypothetical protein
MWPAGSQTGKPLREIEVQPLEQPRPYETPQEDPAPKEPVKV